MAFTVKHGVFLAVAVAVGLVLYYGGASWAMRKIEEFKPSEVIVYKSDPQQEKTLRHLEEERRELLKKDGELRVEIANLQQEILTLKVAAEQDKSYRKTAETRIRELEQALTPAGNLIEKPDNANVNVNEPDHEVREMVRNQGLKGYTKRSLVWVVDDWFPASEFKWPPAGMKANLEVNGQVIASKGDDVTLIRVKYRVAGLGAFDQDCYIKSGVFFAYFDRTTKLLNLVPR